jgi:hypothetical protein
LSGDDVSSQQGQTVQPELGGLVHFRVDAVPDDPDGQVRATIPLMRRYAVFSAATDEIRRDLVTASILGSGDILAGIHSFVHSSLEFRPDEATAAALPGIPNVDTMVEVLVPPVDLSRAIAAGRRPAEDCDGFSMYVAALLLAAGIDCAFVTVAADPAEPRNYSHVYVAARPAAGIRVPIDASHGDYAGWECPNRYGRRAEWPLRSSGIWPSVMIAALLAASAWIALRPAPPGGLEWPN